MCLCRKLGLNTILITTNNTVTWIGTVLLVSQAQRIVLMCDKLLPSFFGCLTLALNLGNRSPQHPSSFLMNTHSLRNQRGDKDKDTDLDSRRCHFFALLWFVLSIYRTETSDETGKHKLQ
jgi:hypothetical protein